MLTSGNSQQCWTPRDNPGHSEHVDSWANYKQVTFSLLIKWLSKHCKITTCHNFLTVFCLWEKPLRKGRKKMFGVRGNPTTTFKLHKKRQSKRREMSHSSHGDTAHTHALYQGLPYLLQRREYCNSATSLQYLTQSCCLLRTGMVQQFTLPMSVQCKWIVFQGKSVFCHCMSGLLMELYWFYDFNWFIYAHCIT